MIKLNFTIKTFNLQNFIRTIIMQKRLLTFISLAFLSYTSSFAQQYCSTDEMHQLLYKADSGIHQKIIQNHNWLQEFTKEYIKNNYNNRQTVSYTIPVVFHVIHLNGQENISDAQIYDQMRIINEDYQKRNADTAAVIPFFKPISADCEIEFKLAKIDPFGNCTKGITRHVDSRTIGGGHNVKEIVQWPPNQYLNIYVCMQAAGLAGHALVPSAADTIAQWDGIVISHNYVGDIGTGDPSRSVVLTHEIGHYLNLYHTWGGNNVPSYPYLPVGEATNCNYDDDVADTPNTIGWSTCNLNHQSCGDLDNVQNFMEYAYCPAMFTNGQKLRMHATLNSPIAGRNNLVSASNLIATGVNLPDEFCKADFTANKTVVCNNNSVSFSDLSYHNASQWQWIFEGGTPSTSSIQNPIINYTTPGLYDVTLIASDGTNSDTLIISDYIRVLSNPGIGTSIIEGFDPYSSIDEMSFYAINYDQQQGWEVTDLTGRNSTKSLMITNLGNLSGQRDEFISFPINLSGMNAVTMSFDVAYAQTATNNQDKLFILVSTDCGQTWNVRKTISSPTLNTAGGIVSTPFIPTQSQWKTETVTTITSGFWSSNFQVMFRFESGGGNNIFIDNINILNPNHVGINEIASSFSIYPNPANEKLTVESSLFDSFEASIYDVTGRLITHFSLMNNEIVDISNLTNGIYMISFTKDGTVVSQTKFIKVTN